MTKTVQFRPSSTVQFSTAVDKWAGCRDMYREY